MVTKPRDCLLLQSCNHCSQSLHNTNPLLLTQSRSKISAFLSTSMWDLTGNQWRVTKLFCSWWLILTPVSPFGWIPGLLCSTDPQAVPMTHGSKEATAQCHVAWLCQHMTACNNHCRPLKYCPPCCGMWDRSQTLESSFWHICLIISVFSWFNLTRVKC